MLEPCDGKLSRTVLKGEWGCKAPDLLDAANSEIDMNEFEEITHTGGLLKFLWDEEKRFSLSFSHSSPYPVVLYQICVSFEGKILEIVPCGGLGSVVPYPQPSILVYMISDREGMFGKLCPSCKSYFREDSAGAISLTCPYCLDSNSSLEFFTQNQLKYIELYCQTYCDSINQEKTLEINIDSLINELPQNRPAWIYDERQQNLFECSNCKCRYDILGEYSCCPTCRELNFEQIFSTKFEAMKNEFTSTKKNVKDRHDREAKWEELTKCVSEFESMGNELKKYLIKFPATQKRKSMIGQLSFQNILKTSVLLRKWLDIEMLKDISEQDGVFLNKMFNRRHILTHNAGRVDDEYLRNTEDTSVRLNQVLRIRSNEINRLLPLVEKCGMNLLTGVKAIK